MRKIEIDRDVLERELRPHVTVPEVSAHVFSDWVSSAIDAAEKAAREPRPVVACVGDEVVYTAVNPTRHPDTIMGSKPEGHRAHIIAPQRKGVIPIYSDSTIACNASLEVITTPAGNPIEAVVPYRIVRLDGGDWHCGGVAYTSSSLEAVQSTCRTSARNMYPWYTGPAHVVEEGRHDAS